MMGAGMNNFQWALAFGLVFLGLWYASQHQGSKSSTAESSSIVSAVEKMRVVFVGDYSALEIEREATETLRLFGQSATEQNIMRLGNILVTLRKAPPYKPEFSMMKCMQVLKRETSNFNLDLPEAAALCSVS